MQDVLTPHITRRDVLIASCGILFTRPGWAEHAPRPILHWPLDSSSGLSCEPTKDFSAEIIEGTGRLEWVKDSDVRRPRLDGYSVWIEQHCKEPIVLNDVVGLSAWLALESFPVSTASIIEWGDEADGVRLAVDRLGFLHMSVRRGIVGSKCKSEAPIARNRWIHVAGSLSQEGGLRLYSEGRMIGLAKGIPNNTKLSPIADVYLGRAAEDLFTAKNFRTNVLNGLLREVRVYSAGLSDLQVRSLSKEFSPHPAPLSTDQSWFAHDSQRPVYHAMPPRAWTNEPHGLVHFRGQYHLFYQKNPNGPYWGHIHWGHMTSPDLLVWTEQAMALTPEPGPDCDGCWSGSAIVAHDRIFTFYTGGDGKRSAICMASSEDGFTFTKHIGNPVIDAPPTGIGVKEFRDPFVWRQGSEYRMIIGSGIDGRGGTALLYKSEDLISWIYIKPLLIGDKSTSGIFWEMPIFVPIGDWHVLVVCEVPGRASYWVGQWEDDNFTPRALDPQRLDVFNHFLSPTPYIDPSGRVFAIGIVPETRASIEQWQAGWAHLYGLTREFTLDARQSLHQTPRPAIFSQFASLLTEDNPQELTSAWTIADTAGASIFVRARVEQKSSEAIVLAVRRSPGREEETLLRYDWSRAMLVFDRSRSSLNVKTVRDVQQVSYQPPTPGVLDFMVFLDNSVIEVFLDGQACFTSRIYPVLPDSIGVAFCAEGGKAAVTHLGVSGWMKQTLPKDREVVYPPLYNRDPAL